jgi:hypothetical protein
LREPILFAPGTSNLSPSQISFMKEILRGNKISAFDGSIIANLASLMTPGQSRLLVKAARNFRVQDLQTDENLVFLGSSRSNPWTSMFDPILDFRFAFNAQTQREFIRNVHSGKGESNEYIPPAGGFIHSMHDGKSQLASSSLLHRRRVTYGRRDSASSSPTCRVPPDQRSGPLVALKHGIWVAYLSWQRYHISLGS